MWLCCVDCFCCVGYVGVVFGVVGWCEGVFVVCLVVGFVLVLG